MGKYSGYLLCTDLDGTLLNDSGELVDINTKAIDEFTKEGGLFTVVTGRAKNYLEEKFGEKLKTNTYEIALNGTVIYDKFSGQIKFEKYFNRKDLIGIDEYIENNKIPVNLTRFHCGEKTAHRLSLTDAKEKINKIVFEFKNVKDCLDFKVNIENNFKGFCEYCRSWDTGLEMLPSGSGKGRCVKELRKLLGEKIHTIIAVGNYENDISMIEEADIGYATENAVDKVKFCADRISVSNNDGAIADIIAKI